VSSPSEIETPSLFVDLEAILGLPGENRSTRMLLVTPTIYSSLHPMGNNIHKELKRESKWLGGIADGGLFFIFIKNMHNSWEY
jgi:hypothetical protein